MHKKYLSTAFNTLGMFILSFWLLITTYPLIWALLGSFKDNNQLYNNPWGLPEVYHVINYIKALHEANIAGFFMNSIFVTAFSIFFGVFLSLFTAYVIARFSSFFTRVIFWIMVASMMLPIVLTLIPKFLIMRDFGLLDDRFGLALIYAASGIPFSVFLMESFFRHLPREFEDSAYLDGASHFQTFIWIILPLSIPGMMVVSIFQFLGAWNEVYHALIMLSSPEKYTIPLGMIRLVEIQQWSIEWGPILAGVVIVLLPMVIFFKVAQEKIAKGLTEGALKG